MHHAKNGTQNSTDSWMHAGNIRHVRCVKARVFRSVQSSAECIHVLSRRHVAASSSQDAFVQLSSSPAMHATHEPVGDKNSLDQNISREDTHANDALSLSAVQCTIVMTDYLDSGVQRKQSINFTWHQYQHSRQL